MTYEKVEEHTLLENALKSIKMQMIQEGVEALLISHEKQMQLDQNQELCAWEPQNLGITVLWIFIDIPELKSSIWNVCNSVECHFLKSKIVWLLP